MVYGIPISRRVGSLLSSRTKYIIIIVIVVDGGMNILANGQTNIREEKYLKKLKTISYFLFILFHYYYRNV